MSTNDDTLRAIGKLIHFDMPRDAIHIAVIPVVAGDKLLPGSKVVMRDGKAFGAREDAVGVIDPFLSQVVNPGDRVWFFALPASITDMHHEWSHPDFPRGPALTDPDDAKRASMAWLQRNVCERFGIRMDTLLEGVEGSDPSVCGDDEDIYQLPKSPDFAAHLAIALGHPVDLERVFFHCSC